MPMWEAPVYVKLHENCGGRVRWVEAIDTPGVGYTGECTECGRERVHVEGILPIKVRGIAPGFAGEFDIRDELLSLDLEARRELRWDDDAGHDENQRRLQDEVREAAGVTA